MFPSLRVHQTSVAAALAGLLLTCGSPVWLGAQTATQPPASHFEVPPTEPSEIALPLPEDRGQADLEQTLKRLGTTASVLMIVAHPDDEDGALLTYLSRGIGARATLLTAQQTLRTDENTLKNLITDDYAKLHDAALQPASTSDGSWSSWSTIFWTYVRSHTSS